MSALPTHVAAQGAGVYSVDAHYLRPGLAASHLIVEDGAAAFVDTGTNYSVPFLLSALEALGLQPEHVEYVLLTHIHLDHAGGAGLLMRSLPNARCVVHPRGSRHMADPSKLMAGTRAVYGEERTERLYGEIRPIDESRLLVPEDGTEITLGSRPLEVFYTEGHARHHYCIHDPESGGVFTGDSFGVSYRALDTAAGAFVFPSTTPVHFDPEAAHAAIETILSRGPGHAYLNTIAASTISSGWPRTCTPASTVSSRLPRLIAWRTIGFNVSETTFSNFLPIVSRRTVSRETGERSPPISTPTSSSTHRGSTCGFLLADSGADS